MTTDTRVEERAQNPQMSDDFARVYEEMADRITGPISVLALDKAGPVFPGMRILDIAAGVGALSVPAAKRGAKVLAIDIAQGMVKRLKERLHGFENCEAEIMDGEALEFPDNEFDATFSIFGVMTFTDWRKGLREQARVTKPGGRGCVATWKKLRGDRPPGSGPFQVLFEALARAFPERSAPAWGDGFAALGDPGRLSVEMTDAGFVNVTVEEVEGVWRGKTGDAFLQEVRELYSYIKPYTALPPNERARVDQEIRDITNEQAVGGVLELTSPVLIACGSAP